MQELGISYSAAEDDAEVVYAKVKDSSGSSYFKLTRSNPQKKLEILRIKNSFSIFSLMQRTFSEELHFSGIEQTDVEELKKSKPALSDNLLDRLGKEFDQYIISVSGSSDTEDTTSINPIKNRRRSHSAPAILVPMRKVSLPYDVYKVDDINDNRLEKITKNSVVFVGTTAYFIKENSFLHQKNPQKFPPSVFISNNDEEKVKLELQELQSELEAVSVDQNGKIIGNIASLKQKIKKNVLETLKTTKNINLVMPANIVSGDKNEVNAIFTSPINLADSLDLKDSKEEQKPVFDNHASGDSSTAATTNLSNSQPQPGTTTEVSQSPISQNTNGEQIIVNPARVNINFNNTAQKSNTTDCFAFLQQFWSKINVFIFGEVNKERNNAPKSAEYVYKRPEIPTEREDRRATHNFTFQR